MEVNKILARSWW